MSSEQTNAELLPCPFCGARLQRQQTSSGHWHEHMGEVEDCYATGSIVFDENIEAWNRRPSRLEAISEAEPVAAWQWSDFSGNWYTVDTNESRISLAEQEQLARACAKEHEGRVRPLYAHTPPADHVVVPVEPTEEMVRAAYRDQPNAINAGFAQAYRAMLAALPHNQGGANG